MGRVAVETARATSPVESAGAGLRFAVLGQVRAWRHGTALNLGWPKQRAVLAVLLLSPHRAAARSDIVDALWGDDPPPSAANLVHTYIRRLRQVLEPERDSRTAGRVLAANGSGYRLNLHPRQCDVDIFSDSVERARRLLTAGDPAAAVEAFDTAHDLWHGAPLTDIAGPFADVERTRLADLRCAALEERARALLALGRSRELITDLITLVAEFPLRERMRALLMTALHHSGQRADALAAYADARRVLVTELGIEPGEELQLLHRDILAGRQVTSGQPAPARPAPRQLPSAVRGFIGRSAQLHALTRLLTDPAGPAGHSNPAAADSAVPIAVIDGTAGVGKTALAGAGRRAARRPRTPGRAGRGRSGGRRPGGVLVVVPAARPGGRAAVPGAGAAPRAGVRRGRGGQPGRAAGRRGVGGAGRAG